MRCPLSVGKKLSIAPKISTFNGIQILQETGLLKFETIRGLEVLAIGVPLIEPISRFGFHFLFAVKAACLSLRTGLF